MDPVKNAIDLKIEAMKSPNSNETLVQVTVNAVGPPEDAEKLAVASLAALKALGFQFSPPPIVQPMVDAPPNGTAS